MLTMRVRLAGLLAAASLGWANESAAAQLPPNVLKTSEGPVIDKKTPGAETIRGGIESRRAERHP